MNTAGKFISHQTLNSEDMRRVRNQDNAVSPIIGTILLIAITVTLVSAAFTLISGYIPSPAATTPTGDLQIVNHTSVKGSAINGTYAITVYSFNGNLSFGNAVLQVVMANDSIIEVNMNSLLLAGGSEGFNGGQLIINLTGDAPFISSTTLMVLQLKSSPVYPVFVAIRDIASGGTVTSSPL